MKVAFYLLQGAMDEYLYDPESKTLHFSILKKVNGVVFYLPYTPTKGMLVDLTRFSKIFNLSKPELDLLRYRGFYLVSELSMTPEYLELQLILREDD
ncbi:hypothetical protein HUW51_17530 [Adhaeribacter swui]|uniref:Uncharacterized protein n=1 Tax=Adhaeribacter swui TaxID=2086471 RepID=A0A7G7GBA3_9BACT|nr:hypothetical protein [Adhaeribacter swui]QNF34437.1 hypothetical protein HUW51_17530 [Adhaeribacter swui]